jgi:hypothetical protein
VKRWLAIGAVVLGLGALLYALFARPTHEERIRAKLERLALVVTLDREQQNPLLRAARLKKEFSELFTASVAVTIPELASPLTGRDELAALGARAGTEFQSVEVGFSKIEVELDTTETRAQVRSVATLTGTRGGELEHDRRRVRFGFVRQDGEWLIDLVSVAAPDGDGP